MLLDVPWVRVYSTYMETQTPDMYRVTRNTGQFGPGRMDWLLVSPDGRLIEHCGLRWLLATDAERLNLHARNGERYLFARDAA